MIVSLKFAQKSVNLLSTHKFPHNSLWRPWKDAMVERVCCLLSQRDLISMEIVDLIAVEFFCGRWKDRLHLRHIILRNSLRIKWERSESWDADQPIDGFTFKFWYNSWVFVFVNVLWYNSELECFVDTRKKTAICYLETKHSPSPISVHDNLIFSYRLSIFACVLPT